MKLSLVKSHIERKLIGDIEMPSDAMLSSFVWEALYFVCTKCMPRELMKKGDVDVDETVLRLVDKGFFIAVPERPIFDKEDASYHESAHLLIDEDLTFAVIDCSVSLITQMKDRKIEYMGDCIRKIQIYKSNFLREVE